MAKLILVRGLPGSGKSTFARELSAAGQVWPKWVHRETDMYFCYNGGPYRFDAKRLPEAHRWCQDATRELLRDGFNVVVSNTFVKKWEMQAYIDMAAELGATLTIVEMPTMYGNIHNVPDSVVERMRRQWEKL